MANPKFDSLYEFLDEIDLGNHFNTFISEYSTCLVLRQDIQLLKPSYPDNDIDLPTLLGMSPNDYLACIPTKGGRSRLFNAVQTKNAASAPNGQGSGETVVHLVDLPLPSVNRLIPEVETPGFHPKYDTYAQVLPWPLTYSLPPFTESWMEQRFEEHIPLDESQLQTVARILFEQLVLYYE